MSPVETIWSLDSVQEKRGFVEKGMREMMKLARGDGRLLISPSFSFRLGRWSEFDRPWQR
jgi:hypothetical protein